MTNKDVFATNLKKYMELKGKSRREVSAALEVSYYTFSDWVNGKKYPRMDKVEQLAKYFGIMKSDLIEDKSKFQEKNDTIVGIVTKLRTNEDFLSIVNDLSVLDSEKLSVIKQVLSAINK